MSHSQFIADRLKQSAPQRHFLCIVYIVITLLYLGWRTTIINEGALWLSIAYYAAEIFGFILGLTVVYSSWSYRHHEPLPPPQNLSIDVFIPTYKEPIDIIRRTLMGAKTISYPHQIILLDDGGRPEIKALAEAMGIRYLARGKNIHAKAGNLNFGLAHSKADFVMVFDADHIPLPHAIDLLLGFFKDPHVAIVQSPQEYYNVNAFQYMNPAKGGGLWHDQSFFYNVAQPCMDANGGASCIGTSVIYRRSALDAIGGFPTDTLTEDMHTSLLLSKAGFGMVYVNEPVAYGVAAVDLKEFYRTRHRWAHGNLHVLSLEILKSATLTWRQRFNYLALGSIYLEGWQQLLLFIVPIVSLFFGMAAFDITPLNVVIVLFFPILTTLILQEMGCGLSRYWVNELFSMMRFPIHLMAITGLFRTKKLFRTSLKKMQGHMDWWLLTPQMTLAAASLTALTAGIFALSQNFQMGPLIEASQQIAGGDWNKVDWDQKLVGGYTLDLVIVAGFWALFNSTRALYVICKAAKDVLHSSEDYRFTIPLVAEIMTPSGPCPLQIEKISTSWLSGQLCGSLPMTGEMKYPIQIYLPAGMMSAEFSPAHIPRKKGDGKNLCHGTLHFSENAQQDFLMKSIYSVDWHREFMARQAFFATPLQSLIDFLSRKKKVQPYHWSPALYKTAAGERRLALVGEKNKFNKKSLLCFEDLCSEDCATTKVLHLEVLGLEKKRPLSLMINMPEPLLTRGSPGLDGANIYRYQAEIAVAKTKEAAAQIAEKIAA
jgi:cellulose synthase (UDP-forming)